MNIVESCKLKSLGYELTIDCFYDAINRLMKNSNDKDVVKFFIALDTFGMTKREVFYLAMSLRDSGRVLKYNRDILEKHSTGGIGDSTSLVMIPILASLGYKIIKTTAKSLVYTNGSADRFGAIPNFKVKFSEDEIQNILNGCNACILSHKGDVCPADNLLYDIRTKYKMENNLNFLAASIVAKKWSSGAGIVLIDIKYGKMALVDSYSKAKKLAKLIKFLFKKNRIECIVVLTDASQTIGEGIGNAVEVVDAINVLQGRRCLLRDVASRYVVEMIRKVDKKLTKKEAYNLVNNSLDSGSAYYKFLDIVKMHGGDYKLLADAKMFNPYKSINFRSEVNGYVSEINSKALGEILNNLCKITHDNNIGVVLRVKIGDYIRRGDIIVAFYYKDDKDLDDYKESICKCIRLSTDKVKKINVTKKVIR